MRGFKEWCDKKYQIKEICFNKVIHRKIVKGNQSLPEGVTSSPALFRPGQDHYERLRAMSNLPQGDTVPGKYIEGTAQLDSNTCPYIDDRKEGLALKIIANDALTKFITKYNLKSQKRLDVSDNYVYLMDDIGITHLLNEYHLELKSKQIDEPNTEKVLNAWERKVASLVTNTQFKDSVDQISDFLEINDINDIKDANSTPIYSGYLLLLKAYGELYRELLTPIEYDDLQKIIGELDDALKNGTLTGDLLHKKQSQITSERLWTDFLGTRWNGEDVLRFLRNSHEDIKHRQQSVFHNQMLEETKKLEEAYVDKTRHEISAIINSRASDVEAIIYKGPFPNYFTICYKDTNNLVHHQPIPITSSGFLLGNTYYTELNALLNAVANNGKPIQLLKNSDLLKLQHPQEQARVILEQRIDALQQSGYVVPRSENVDLFLLREKDQASFVITQGTDSNRFTVKSYIRDPSRRPSEGIGEAYIRVTDEGFVDDVFGLFKCKTVDELFNALKASHPGREKLSFAEYERLQQVANQPQPPQPTVTTAQPKPPQPAVVPPQPTVTTAQPKPPQPAVVPPQPTVTTAQPKPPQPAVVPPQPTVTTAQPKPPQPAVVPPQPPQPIQPAESREVYYQQQMNFLDRAIRNQTLPEDAQRMQRIVTLQKQQKIYFQDEFLDIEPGKELETTRIGHFPLERVKPTDAYIQPQQLTLATDGGLIHEQNRRLTRYRSVYGPVPFYLGNQRQDATTIPVISTCGPNLMGTSLADLEEFSKAGQLDAAEYQKIAEKIAEYQIGIAKINGHKEFITSAFSVGAYIRQLNPIMSQDEAKRIMYQAFATAAQKHAMALKWVVWKDPADSNSEAKAEATAQMYRGYSPNNTLINVVVHSDMLSYAKQRQDEGHNVVILNPGSDRTIGGKYVDPKAPTLEEQIARQSDLILLHSDINKPMVAAFYNEFNSRKASHPQWWIYSTLSKLGIPNAQVDTPKLNRPSYIIAFQTPAAATVLQAMFTNTYGFTPQILHEPTEQNPFYLEFDAHQWNLISNLKHPNQIKKENSQTLSQEFSKISAQLNISDSRIQVKHVHDTHYAIQFNDKFTAQSFLKTLIKFGVQDDRGNLQFVQDNRGKLVVYLNAVQWAQLPDVAKQYVADKNIQQGKEQEQLKKQQEDAQKLSPAMHQQNKKEFDQRLKAQQQIQNEFGTISKHLHLQLELGFAEPLPEIALLAKGDYRISFKNRSSADHLSLFLASHQIKGEKGNNKFVLEVKDAQGEAHYALFLTPDQWKALPNLRREVAEKKPGDVQLPKDDIQQEFRKVALGIKEQFNWPLTTSLILRNDNKGNYYFSFAVEDHAKAFKAFLAQNTLDIEKKDLEQYKDEKDVKKRTFHRLQVNEKEWKQIRGLFLMNTLNKPADKPKEPKKPDVIISPTASRFSAGGQEEPGQPAGSKPADKAKEPKQPPTKKPDEGSPTALRFGARQEEPNPQAGGQSKEPGKQSPKTQAETLKLKTIENILNGFSEKIKTMPFRSEEAKNMVTELHKGLSSVFTNYQQIMLTPDSIEKEKATQDFYTSFKTITTHALDNEVLKNDRPWWTYVVNMFKAIGNAIGYVFSAGSNATFFPYVTSQSVKEVEQLQNEVEPPVTPPKKS